MAMSVHQRRIVRLLHEGFQLRIVRSLIDNSPVYAELSNADLCYVERIPMWRVDKLIYAGAVRPDSGDLATAHRLVATHRHCRGACRWSPRETVAS